MLTLDCITKQASWRHKEHDELLKKKINLKKALQKLNFLTTDHALSWSTFLRDPEVLAWCVLYSLWHIDRCPWKKSFQILQSHLQSAVLMVSLTFGFLVTMTGLSVKEWINFFFFWLKLYIQLSSSTFCEYCHLFIHHTHDA